MTQGSKEDRIVFARVTEAAEASRQGKTSFTDFLDPVKARRVYDEFNTECKMKLYGGTAFTERAAAGFCPDFSDAEIALADEAFPIARIKIIPNGVQQLKHKDYLGAMTAVVGRNKIGDIVVNKTGAFTFVKTEAAEILLALLHEVGRVRVTCEITDEVEFDGFFRPELKTAFAESLRLDGILAKCFHISRGDALTAVKTERVYLNWVTAASAIG
jgi:RNA-binding protein YlmH